LKIKFSYEKKKLSFKLISNKNIYLKFNIFPTIGLKIRKLDPRNPGHQRLSNNTKSLPQYLKKINFNSYFEVVSNSNTTKTPILQTNEVAKGPTLVGNNSTIIDQNLINLKNIITKCKFFVK
jgi:hypothetical protein